MTTRGLETTTDPKSPPSYSDGEGHQFGCDASRLLQKMACHSPAPKLFLKRLHIWASHPLEVLEAPLSHLQLCGKLGNKRLYLCPCPSCEPDPWDRVGDNDRTVRVKATQHVSNQMLRTTPSPVLLPYQGGRWDEMGSHLQGRAAVGPGAGGLRSGSWVPGWVPGALGEGEVGALRGKPGGERGSQLPQALLAAAGNN